jgi:TetR/AcrR family transcriptional repressor of nem operon
MVQNPIQSRGGRPRRFDEADVVAKAVTTFWSHGYEGTTLDDLERATGVDRSTIYNSFGGKAGLYQQAATEYVQRGDSYLFVPLTDGREGLADIVEFLDLLEAIQLDDSYPPGCLIINDLATPANEDVTDRYLAAIDTGLKAAIERSNRFDHTDPRNNESRRESLLAAIIGANLTHRRDPTTAANMMEGLRTLVQTWTNS